MRLQDSVTMATVHIGGQTMLLLPEKAVFLPESDTLVVADAHFGKAVTFHEVGSAGLGMADESLEILGMLVRRFNARRMVFLGDFLHAMRSRSPTVMAALTQWRREHARLELQLVRGNEDERSGDPPAELGIDAVEEPLMLGSLALCHQPQPVAGAYVLAGHLHPCVSVGGRAHDWLRMPCYWFTREFGVLPAFGAFTGMQTIWVRSGERVFAATPERVFELAPKRC